MIRRLFFILSVMICVTTTAYAGVFDYFAPIDKFPKQDSNAVKNNLNKLGIADFDYIFSFQYGKQNIKIIKLYSRGNSEFLNIVLPLPDTDEAILYYGSSNPLSSPDKKHILYIKDHNLWLFNVSSGKHLQVTTSGYPTTDVYNSSVISIVGWSLNSKKVIYYLHPGFLGDGGDDSGEYVDKKDRALVYGFYVYDLESKTQNKIELPGGYLGWLSNEQLLLISDKENQLLTYNLSDRSIKKLVPLEGCFSQTVISLDGKWVITSYSPKLGSDSQILLINADKLNILKLTHVTPWATDQFPKLSPTLQHFSYIKMTGKFNEAYSVFVDNKKIFSQDYQFDYFWINDETICIENNNSQPIIKKIQF